MPYPIIPIIPITPITLITPITPITPISLLLQKKRPRPRWGAADQQSKNHILQKEYFPFISIAPMRQPIGLLRALWEPSRGEQCAVALKTSPKSRINQNCRVIQIVTLFVCVGAVLCALLCLRLHGTRPAQQRSVVTLGCRVVAPRSPSLLLLAAVQLTASL